MGEQTKNMLIGLFVVIACALMMWIILFLKPNVGNGKETLYVRFANINQIGVGTRVLFAGRPVGEVTGIESIHDARQKPIADTLGDIYYYQLILKIDSSIKVYDTDEIIVQTSGLLGEKSIAIIPRVPPQGILSKRITHQPIYANSIDPIENTFYELASLSKEMKLTFNLLSQWMHQNGGALSETINTFQETLSEIKGVTTSVRTAFNQLEESDFFINAGITLKNFKEASEEIKIATTNVATGKGTLGKLITDDDIYLQLGGLIRRVDTLMYNLNHYGLLFHLNKSWQRQRAKEGSSLPCREIELKRTYPNAG